MCYFVNLDLQCYNNVPINTFMKENVAGEMDINTYGFSYNILQLKKRIIKSDLFCFVISN